MESIKEKENLKEVAGLFFKLGCIAFGGPAAHIAMMQDEVVRRRRWITDEHFLDLVGATNLIPGPNSTEMTMHCGYQRAGIKGLVVAGICFIVPAVIITAIVALLYNNYGQLPAVQPFIYGIKPAIIALIVAMMINLGQKALKSITLGIIGIFCMVLVFVGVNEIVVLFGAGLAGIVIYLATNRKEMLSLVSPVVLLQVNQEIGISNLKIFLIFLKVGAILYGSGYVLFAFLEAELVEQGLLSRQVLIDAIAVGQFTPGPVFSSATFIGWQMGGMPGAIAATAGIFLPAFIFVILLNPIIPRLRKSKIMSAFLDTVNIASVAIILSVAFEMGKDVFIDWRTILIALCGFVITFVLKKINSALIVAGGAVAGYLLYLL